MGGQQLISETAAAHRKLFHNLWIMGILSSGISTTSIICILLAAYVSGTAVSVPIMAGGIIVLVCSAVFTVYVHKERVLDSRLECFVMLMGESSSIPLLRISRIAGIDEQEVRDDIAIMITKRWLPPDCLQEGSLILTKRSPAADHSGYKAGSALKKLTRSMKTSKSRDFSRYEQNIRVFLESGYILFDRIAEIMEESRLPACVSEKLFVLRALILRMLTEVKTYPSGAAEMVEFVNKYAPNALILFERYDEEMGKNAGIMLQHFQIELCNALDELRRFFSDAIDLLFDEDWVS